MYLVVAFREGEPDRHFLLRQGSCLIGRVPEANLKLPDSTVSRKHATLRLCNGAVLIEDLDSFNGVFINGEQVGSATVREGDFVTIGAYTLVLRGIQDSESPGLPKGKTSFIGFDAARKIHEEAFEAHIPKRALALYKAALLFREPLRFSELLQQMLGLLLESLAARRGIVVTCSSDGTTPKVASTMYLDGVSSIRNLDPRLISYVVNTRTALLTEDAQEDPRFHCASADATADIHVDTGPAMCVPLCASGEALGVLYVDTRRGASPFTADDLDFLSAVGHVVGVVVENRMLGQRLARQERLAVLGQAVGGIVHDVRNLLTGVQAGVDMLGTGRDIRDPEREMKVSALVHRCLNQIDAYLNNMLMFLRESEIHRAPTPINEMIREALDTLGQLAEERKVHLSFQAGGFENAHVDRIQMHRVIVNLVKNGIEACEGKGGGAVQVSVTHKADTLIVQVADTGAGITPEDMPRISEPFFTRGKRTGSGLGLAVSYQIVEKHGGTVTVASDPGKGSVFTVVIPECFPQKAPSLHEKKRTLFGETPFRRCPTCYATWLSQDDFLADRSVNIAGYQARFEEPSLGIFFFNHHCGTTLAAPASDFRHLYDGPVFATAKTGTDECPGYCLKKDELASCPAQCECAYVREVLQILKNWPKK